VPPYVSIAGRVVVFEMGEFGPYGYAPNQQGIVTVALPGGQLPSTIPATGVDSMRILSYELP
jgi:hypothetical protein